MPTRLPPRRSSIWLTGCRVLQAYLRRAKQRELADTAKVAKARLLQEGVLPERRQAARRNERPGLTRYGDGGLERCGEPLDGNHGQAS